MRGPHPDVTTNQEPERLAGRWRVDGEGFGRGGMGRVVLVTDSCAGGVPLAAKVLERSELRADFVAEVELLRRLAHPGFPAVHGLVLEAGASARLFALLERVDGAPLAPERAADARPRFRSIAGDLARALNHLHRHGHVHRGPGARQRLVAPRCSSQDHRPRRGRRARRALGRTSGVLAYQPPERLTGAPLAPTGDLWALGALLFGLAHGRHPFPGWPAWAAWKGPNRRGLARHTLDPLFNRLLAADPAARFPSAAAFAAELEAATGVPQPLALATAHEPPWVETGLLPELVDTIEAARGRRPVTVDIGGGHGSGRSRLLGELALRLAARGVPVIAAPLEGDEPTRWVAALLAGLGHDFEASGAASRRSRARASWCWSTTSRRARAHA